MLLPYVDFIVWLTIV
jgi:DnaJ family protein A protein 2